MFRNTVVTGLGGSLLPNIAPVEEPLIDFGDQTGGYPAPVHEAPAVSLTSYNYVL